MSGRPALPTLWPTPNSSAAGLSLHSLLSLPCLAYSVPGLVVTGVRPAPALPGGGISCR
jgi:hypothetical protein